MELSKLCLIIGIIFLFLAELNPIFYFFAIIMGVIVSVLYPRRRLGYGNLFWGLDDAQRIDTVSSIKKERESARRKALENVRLFLSPYKSIWADLKVSNKYCVMRLGRDGKTITISEHPKNVNEYRKLKIKGSQVWNPEEVWNNLCMHFEYFTSYDGFRELSNTFQIIYTETTINVSETQIGKKPLVSNREFAEKLDINNASEIEITALPGISIVLSKKLIRKREEIGGFKSIEDVFLYLKLKPHMEKQLRNLICVNKMNGSSKITRNIERKIDL